MRSDWRSEKKGSTVGDWDTGAPRVHTSVEKAAVTAVLSHRGSCVSVVVWVRLIYSGVSLRLGVCFYSSATIVFYLLPELLALGFYREKSSAVPSTLSSEHSRAHRFSLQFATFLTLKSRHVFCSKASRWPTKKDHRPWRGHRRQRQHSRIIGHQESHIHVAYLHENELLVLLGKVLPLHELQGTLRPGLAVNLQGTRRRGRERQIRL